MGKKIYNFVKKNNLEDIITTILTIIFTIIVCWTSPITISDVFTNFDISILSSLAVIMVARILSQLIKDKIESLYEDSAKLETNYVDICEKYGLNHCVECGENDKTHKFPITIECYCDDVEVENDENSFYKLPTFIENHSDELMEVHSKSNISNNIMIRCKDIILENGKARIFTERTTYYDTLISNKAMDYLLQCKRSLREMYEPGPYVSKLKLSKMSNHMGFNGFVVSSDDELVFIRRGNKVSINKDKWSCSISASVKALYSLDKETGKLTREGLLNSVVKEIKDELNLDVSANDINIFAFYRDLIQGGKPEFFFYTKVSQTAEQIKKKFIEISSEKDAKNNMNIDGTHIETFSRSMFADKEKFEYTKNGIKIGGEDKNMGASYVVCLYEVLKKLNNIESQQ